MALVILLVVPGWHWWSSWWSLGGPWGVGVGVQEGSLSNNYSLSIMNKCLWQLFISYCLLNCVPIVKYSFFLIIVCFNKVSSVSRVSGITSTNPLGPLVGHLLVTSAVL